MSEKKTREDIISEYSPHGEFNVLYHEHDILEMLTEFADQEKRSTAIAFAEWIQKNKIETDCRGRWIDFRESPAPRYASVELYDLFINSL